MAMASSAPYELRLCQIQFNPLTAKLFHRISLSRYKVDLWHSLIRHQIFFYRFFRRQPNTWFYFVKKVLVLCKSAVYLFFYTTEFSTRWWKQHLDSTNSTSYKNSGRHFWAKNFHNLQYKFSWSNHFCFLIYIFIYNVVWTIQKNFLINKTLIWWCVTGKHWRSGRRQSRCRSVKFTIGMHQSLVAWYRCIFDTSSHFF